MSASDVAYLVANGLVAFAYLLMANVWFRPGRPFVMTPPSMRILIALTITLDAVAYLLDALARFWSIFYRVNFLAHVALAAVAIVTAYTVVKRAQAEKR